MHVEKVLMARHAPNLRVTSAITVTDSLMVSAARVTFADTRIGTTLKFQPCGSASILVPRMLRAGSLNEPLVLVNDVRTNGNIVPPIKRQGIFVVSNSIPYHGKGKPRMESMWVDRLYLAATGRIWTGWRITVGWSAA